jgi:hypothetical protein
VTGERLLHAPAFRPTGYHRSGRCFFAAEENALTLGRVVAT